MSRGDADRVGRGSGPPTDFVPHAVERFRRADPSRTTPGNGLGLALVHTLVTRSGGELRMCTGGAHYLYPPTMNDTAPCQHPTAGTHVTVALPGAVPRRLRQ
jgi:two-component system OmpR family sensor kinase